MKSSVSLALACLALGSAAVSGQVYESKDASGAPVYSDRPSPDAKPVDIRAPNVISPQQTPTSAPPPEPAFSYSRLSILAPEQQGTVHTNTGAFDVKLLLSPDLRTGDAFVLKLDGNTLPSRYTSANIALTEQDFASAAAGTHQHSLSVSVVDANGKSMIDSGPVNFYVNRAIVRERRLGR